MLFAQLQSRSFGSLVSVFVLAASAVGCSGAENSVTPNVEMVNRTTQALDTGSLQWVNGTYSGCTNRNGAWSARIAGAAAMDNPALSVVMGDVACALTLAEVVGASSFVATPSIALGTSYATSASAFAVPAGAVLFYGNAKLSAVSFDSNFSLTVLFSDNLVDTSPNVGATYASVSSAANGEVQVPAPDYTLDFASLSVQTDVNQIVKTSTGTVGVTEVSHLGESYVIDTNQALGPAFADIDAAYAAGTALAVSATIPAASFTLFGETLPIVRNVIVLHTESGVKSYEVIRITFNAAA